MFFFFWMFLFFTFLFVDVSKFEDLFGIVWQGVLFFVGSVKEMREFFLDFKHIWLLSYFVFFVFNPPSEIKLLSFKRELGKIVFSLFGIFLNKTSALFPLPSNGNTRFSIFKNSSFDEDWVLFIYKVNYFYCTLNSNKVFLVLLMSLKIFFFDFPFIIIWYFNFYIIFLL